MPTITRSMDPLVRLDEMEKRLDSTSTKVDTMAEEWDVAKQLAEERHQAIQSQLAEIVSLLAGNASKPSTSKNGAEIDNQVDDSDSEPNRISIETPGFCKTLGNRDAMLKKVEMPVFEGVDAFAWFNLVERFLSIGKYTDMEKLELVSVSLTGRALSWYNWEVRRNRFGSWREFKSKLLRRFGMGRSLSPKERLFSLKQEGSIEDYVHEFEDLSSQTMDLDDESLKPLRKPLPQESLTLIV